MYETKEEDGEKGKEQEQEEQEEQEEDMRNGLVCLIHVHQ
jgi:hypothetical protein